LKRLIRVLVVDDYPGFRDWLCNTIRQIEGLEIVGEASDGLEAVRKSQDLHPDLILLDIGLPKLNGIEVARWIRNLSPHSKILVVSEQRSWYIVEEALRSGADGYLIKSDAAGEIRLALESILEGKQFVSKSAERERLAKPADIDAQQPGSKQNTLSNPAMRAVSACHHEASFYSDDQRLMEDLVPFIGIPLRAGRAAIVLATESHRGQLLQRLTVYGLDIDAAIKQGRYIALDAADMLSKFMSNGMIDRARLISAFGALIEQARKSAEQRYPRVAVFGECVQLLLSRGNPEAAIQMEKAGNELLHKCNIDILCGYSLNGLEATMDGLIYQQICAEHTCVHSS
jgi:DNA-binding NarL/FixJ family response regulator